MGSCVTHHRSLVGTAHREAPSPLQASCCSSTWPWWCWRLWGRSIFLRRIWWNRSFLWYLTKEKRSKSGDLKFYFSCEQRDAYLSFNDVCCAIMLTNSLSHRSSGVCCQRERSLVGMSTGSCLGCWCRCQTGRCWTPHTHWYLGKERKRVGRRWRRGEKRGECSQCTSWVSVCVCVCVHVGADGLITNGSDSLVFKCSCLSGLWLFEQVGGVCVEYLTCI